MIKIAERFRPFTHTPGQKFPIPFTQVGIQIFPAAIKMLPSQELIPLNIQGPVKGFTALLDLERGAIKVFGHAANGFFRYWIFGRDGKIFFKPEKGEVFHESPFEQSPLPAPPDLERLSLGITKVLDWDLVKRRMLFAEILPVWFHLGQTIPYSGQDAGPSLLSQFSQSSKTEIEPTSLSLFETGFSGVLYPLTQDENYMGHVLPPASNASLILSQGAAKIRSLFFLAEKSTYFILPNALKLFHSGRLTNWKASFGSIAIEWSNGKLKKMEIDCQKSGEYLLHFPKEYRSCRTNVRAFQLNKPLLMEEGYSYIFDQFQK